MAPGTRISRLMEGHAFRKVDTKLADIRNMGFISVIQISAFYFAYNTTFFISVTGD
jgi:hypothetical protein